MKRFFGLVGLMMVLAILLAPLPAAQAQTPVERSFTLGTNVTYASTNYTTGIQTPAFTSFKPLALDVKLGATNATVSLKRSATGASYYSYAMGTETNKILFVTNDFYFIRGDTIVVGVGAVDIGGVVKILGLEQ